MLRKLVYCAMFFGCVPASNAPSSEDGQGANLVNNAKDEGCTFDVQCGTGLVCRKVEGSSRCEPRATDGTTCGADNECVSALCVNTSIALIGSSYFCIGSTPPSQEGQHRACSTYEPVTTRIADCPGSLVCRPYYFDPTSILKEERCEPPAHLGETCFEDDDCGVGLVCLDASGLTTGTCGTIP